MLYLQGLGGLTKDLNKAIELFEKSAKLGEKNAAINLGSIYMD